MATLYELTAEYQQIYDLFSSGDIDEQTLNDSLEGMMFDERFEEKAENCAHVCKMLDADKEAVDAEIKRLTARKKSFADSSKRLKDKLYEAMVQTGKTKFKTPLYSFGIQANPARVVVDDIGKLQGQNQYWKPRKWDESELDKTKIKEMLLSGACVPGAHIEQGESLRIR